MSSSVYIRHLDKKYELRMDDEGYYLIAARRGNIPTLFLSEDEAIEYFNNFLQNH